MILASNVSTEIFTVIRWQRRILKVQETKGGKKERHLAQIRALKPRQLRRKRCQGRMDVRVLCSIILGVEPEFSLVIDWEGCNLLRRLHAASGGGGYPGRRPVRRARNLVHILRRVWSEFSLTGWDDCQSAPGTRRKYQLSARVHFENSTFFCTHAKTPGCFSIQSP